MIKSCLACEIKYCLTGILKPGIVRPLCNIILCRIRKALIELSGLKVGHGLTVKLPYFGLKLR